MLWLCCWTVSGNSGLSLTSDQSKELRSMEESEHSTSPRSSFVAPNIERKKTGNRFLFFWKNRSKCSLFLIHPIVESESSFILPIPLKELTRISKRDDILTDLSLDHLLPTLLAWPYPLLEWKHYAKSFFLFLTLLAGSRDYLISGTTLFDY